MRQFIVRIGNYARDIEAENHKEAMKKLFSLFDGDEDPPDEILYHKMISAIDVTEHTDELFWEVDQALKEAGRLASNGVMQPTHPPTHPTTRAS